MLPGMLIGIIITGLLRKPIPAVLVTRVPGEGIGANLGILVLGEGTSVIGGIRVPTKM
jgi:hypothetical protein